MPRSMPYVYTQYNRHVHHFKTVNIFFAPLELSVRNQFVNNRKLNTKHCAFAGLIGNRNCSAGCSNQVMAYAQAKTCSPHLLVVFL